MGSRLYSAKTKVKGLTPVVIGYVQKCFTYCIKRNKGNSSALLEGLSTIVPHAFGEHEKCKEWCSYNEDPINYRHNDLPGGRDLKGADLRTSIEDALKPFLTEEDARKLAPVGSSQRDKCRNSVVGSKEPKIRHYGGSESSDFKTATGVAQYNEGYKYVAEAAKEMGLARNTQAEKYIKKMDAKQEQDFRRKSQRDFKRARRNHRKSKSQKTHTLVLHEGVTYDSGIGFRQSAEEKATISNDTLNDLKESLTQEEFV